MKIMKTQPCTSLGIGHRVNEERLIEESLLSLVRRAESVAGELGRQVWPRNRGSLSSGIFLGGAAASISHSPSSGTEARSRWVGGRLCIRSGSQTTLGPQALAPACSSLGEAIRDQRLLCPAPSSQSRVSPQKASFSPHYQAVEQ